jgi:hypothetical protein
MAGILHGMLQQGQVRASISRVSTANVDATVHHLMSGVSLPEL